MNNDFVHCQDAGDHFIDLGFIHRKHRHFERRRFALLLNRHHINPELDKFRPQRIWHIE